MSQRLNKASANAPIEAGKIADIIAVRGDPLADLNALRRTCFVIADGAIVAEPAPGC